MIQGGDPAGSGSGDVGFEFKNETSPDSEVRPPRTPGLRQRRSRTRTARSSSSPKFPTRSLNGGYTIFGQCDEATVALVKQIARMGRDANDRPYRPVKITHIVIAKGGAAPAAAAKRGNSSQAAVKKPAAAATAPK